MTTLNGQPQTHIKQLARWLEWILVAGVFTAVFLIRINTVSFHPDESHWTATSYYLESFLSGDIQADEWQESYWTLTQPPLARYIIGLGRRLGGYQTGDLNQPWSFVEDEATNRANGWLPEPDLLWWARLPMALLAGVCGLILWYAATKAAGPIAGYSLVIFFLAMPFHSTQLVRAAGEASLLACTLLATLAASQGMKHFRRATIPGVEGTKRLLRPLLWFCLAAVLCGLAGAAKLNGLLATGAVITLCVLVVRSPRNSAPFVNRFPFLLASLVAIPLLAAITFIALNPYLYPDPVTHLEHMAEHRTKEISNQQTATPHWALPTGDLLRRAKIVPSEMMRYTLNTDVVGWKFLAFTFAAVGGVVLLRQTWQWWRDGREWEISAAFLVMGIIMAGPSLLMPLDWDRYYLMPVVWTTLYIAVGISFAFQAAIKKLFPVYAAGSSK